MPSASFGTCDVVLGRDADGECGSVKKVATMDAAAEKAAALCSLFRPHQCNCEGGELAIRSPWMQPFQLLAHSVVAYRPTLLPA